jgi:hypothetical protein
MASITKRIRVVVDVDVDLHAYQTTYGISSRLEALEDSQRHTEALVRTAVSRALEAVDNGSKLAGE